MYIINNIKNNYVDYGDDDHINNYYNNNVVSAYANVFAYTFILSFKNTNVVISY